MRYCVGIDVGLHSVGFAAIELDEAGSPLKILNAVSHIHDAGLDPDNIKEAKTRRLVSGVARRTRRMYEARRKRLFELDKFLEARGYPIINLEQEPEKASWHARAVLATERISDEETQKKLLSMAVRHIARHRGWRNPYVAAEQLCAMRPPSSAFLEVLKKANSISKKSLTPESTLAQLVVALPDGTTRLRGEGGLLSERLLQQDFANEILLVSKQQGLSESFTRELILKVFAAKSPKGSAEQRVGKDELDPAKPRAWRAVLAFQKYRIISLLANVRLKDADGVQRSLSVEERERVFEFLFSWTGKEDPTWSSVAELLDVDRGQLIGTASSNDDGERVTSTPPVNQTDRVFRNCSVKAIRKFWVDGSEEFKSALIREFSNVESNDDDSPAAIAASSLMRSLTPEELEKVSNLALPSGRAAYSIDTLEALTQHMLSNESDLHRARIEVFGVSDTWAPSPAPITEQTGNAAVDRVLKEVHRWLLMAERRWGVPESVNIEHWRNGFKSERVARELERDMTRRSKRNLETVAQMAETLGISGRPRRSDLNRYQSIQRQNCQCLYCGTTIDFKTAEMDHIVPRAGVGSTNTRTNLVAVCHDCNSSKGNLPFAVWARKTSNINVSLESAIERVNQWPADPGLSTKQMKEFKREVIRRLKRTTEDEEIDARSKESVAWMANELRHRLFGHFKGIVQSDEDLPKIRVFRGAVTAAARKASGIEKQITMIGSQPGKSRLDKRHHAIDAAVIALMQDYVAQTLAERDSLRTQENNIGTPDTLYGQWKEFRGRTVAHRQVFQNWSDKMSILVQLLQEALDENRIQVTENLRLRLGNGLVHEESIHSLDRVALGNKLPIELIDRAATPALWCALTRQPDFNWKTGLPASANRTISVNGTHFAADDSIEFFTCKAGALKVRGGFVELGSAFHHARLYRIPNGKKVGFAMMRVYTVDLAKHRNSDLFAVELSPQSISVRQCEPKLRQALRDGTAEYLTWFVVGDELHFDPSPIATGQSKTFIETFGAVKHWRVRGFYSNSRLRLKPAYFSTEFDRASFHPDCAKVIDSPGWLPAVNKLFSGTAVTLVRRDSHGRVRMISNSHSPTSYRIQ